VITPLAWLGRTVAGPLLGSKLFWEVMLVVGLVIGVYAWRVHEQNLGAYREQAKQQAAQLVQDQHMLAAQSMRLSVAKAAQARSESELRRYQNAKLHDKATVDWLAVCGSRPLPLSVRDYVTGVQAVDPAKPDGADSTTGAAH